MTDTRTPTQVEINALHYRQAIQMWASLIIRQASEAQAKRSPSLSARDASPQR